MLSEKISHADSMKYFQVRTKIYPFKWEIKRAAAAAAAKCLAARVLALELESVRFL